MIQCNGNRREDYHFVGSDEPAFGPPHWVAGAISNSTWAGMYVSTVLDTSIYLSLSIYISKPLVLLGLLWL